jgi:hypothetical protein
VALSNLNFSIMNTILSARSEKLDVKIALDESHSTNNGSARNQIRMIGYPSDACTGYLIRFSRCVPRTRQLFVEVHICGQRMTGEWRVTFAVVTSPPSEGAMEFDRKKLIVVIVSSLVPRLIFEE